MENHLLQCLYQPQKLLEDLKDTEAQQFRTAMRFLLKDKEGRLVRCPGVQGAGVQGQAVRVVLTQTELESGADLSSSPAHPHHLPWPSGFGTQIFLSFSKVQRKSFSFFWVLSSEGGRGASDRLARLTSIKQLLCMWGPGVQR